MINFYRTDEFKKMIMFFIRRSITLIVSCCFAFVWTEYYSSVITNPFFRKGNWALVFLYMVLYHLFTNLYGGYRIGTERITDIVYSNWLTIVIVNSVTYLQISLIGRRFQDPFPLWALLCLQLLIVPIWSLCVNRIYFKMFKPKQLICLYNGDDPSRIIDRFISRPDKFNISKTIRVYPGNSDFYAQLSDSDGVLIYNIPDEKSAEILKHCVEKGIRYYLVPSLGDIILRTSDIIYLEDIPLLMSKNEGLYLGQRILKRTFDIFFSVIFLVVFSPLMTLAALAIKLCDGGPIFYTQERCTERAKKFNILKFRTMIIKAEEDGVARLAQEDDPRVTPVGKYLRQFRLDELPQLINILKGEMSFVGPRPERPEFIELYKEKLPEFDFRLSVKSGLTGFAQVLGKYNTTPEEKLKLDLIYIQTYSFLLDIKILLMTLKAVFSKESSQGI
ncbi:MAG: sugar transferase [Synergistaceae bacterium]|nr:sugar transferase [Synergistaceae bacterium]